MAVFVEEIASSVPGCLCETEEVLASLSSKLSPELVGSIRRTGVERRYSSVANVREFLLCREPMRLESSTMEIARQASIECLERSGADPKKIGLLIAATNTPDRPLPCLASELMASLNGRVPATANVVSMQGQGCSVLPKAVDLVRWFLSSNPEKLALVAIAETHTPHNYRLNDGQYFSFKEISQNGGSPKDKMRMMMGTDHAIQNMLFGDGAVSLLLGSRETNLSFDHTAHLTNIEPDDAKLLTTAGRNELENVRGAEMNYRMSRDVPYKGAAYALAVVNELVAGNGRANGGVNDLTAYMIHTGSRKILDGVCQAIGLDSASDKVKASYDVLRNFGNLSAASVGFMLASGEFESGEAVMTTFGAGFSASAASVTFQ